MKTNNINLVVLLACLQLVTSTESKKIIIKQCETFEIEEIGTMNEEPKNQTNTLAGDKQRLISLWKEKQIINNKAIYDAFSKVPRELFVLPNFVSQSYEDKALPIPSAQTISQPSTVVRMLDALKIQPGLTILEIGAGSGYNAALLGALVGLQGKVVSTEIIPELFEFATKNIKSAGITNVDIVKANGSVGYRQFAPYDRIIVTAAAPKIPDALIDQLKENGILLIPVGEGNLQRMIRARKVNGKLETEDLGAYRFVPLTGKYGQKLESKA